MNCPACRAEIPNNLQTCPRCGTPLQQNPFQSPERPAVGQHTPQYSESDATGGIIPYKNPKALFAYYLGLAAILPLIGLPIGIASLTLGILGLRARKQNPAIKGSAHAAIGIGCGVLGILVWGGSLIMIIIGILMSPNR